MKPRRASDPSRLPRALGFLSLGLMCYLSLLQDVSVSHVSAVLSHVVPVSLHQGGVVLVSHDERLIRLGGVVLVSHDERLIRLVCRELWVCENGRVSRIDGGFDEYKHILHEQFRKEGYL
ncbi:hypothetical protein WMY93_009910 [Mugilogobius chulae]|uniref:Uncharacterized protein n=1 Tax=Mugilogobius chulae TaxID=88201 RepID=A0AAW0PHD0_9GOBI